MTVLTQVTLTLAGENHYDHVALNVFLVCDGSIIVDVCVPPSDSTRSISSLTGPILRGRANHRLSHKTDNGRTSSAPHIFPISRCSRLNDISVFIILITKIIYNDP